MRRDGPGARRFASRRSQLKPRSDKRVDAAADERDVRETVFRRDGYRCVVKPWEGEAIPNLAFAQAPDDLDQSPVHLIPRCWGPLTFGHRRKASAGGAYVPANGVTLCQGHNEWCEDEPDAARDLGGETPWWLVVREGDDEWSRLGRKANGVR